MASAADEYRYPMTAFDAFRSNPEADYVVRFSDGTREVGTLLVIRVGTQDVYVFEEKNYLSVRTIIKRHTFVFSKTKLPTPPFEDHPEHFRDMCEPEYISSSEVLYGFTFGSDRYERLKSKLWVYTRDGEHGELFVPTRVDPHEGTYRFTTKMQPVMFNNLRFCKLKDPTASPSNWTDDAWRDDDTRLEMSRYKYKISSTDAIGGNFYLYIIAHEIKAARARWVGENLHLVSFIEHYPDRIISRDGPMDLYGDTPHPHAMSAGGAASAVAAAAAARPVVAAGGAGGGASTAAAAAAPIGVGRNPNEILPHERGDNEIRGGSRQTKKKQRRSKKRKTNK